ncbi:MAG: beta-lactamase family protein [Chloroflexi bacterium]|nr:beta-lactamase family protein [Chloroflexota bacterium]
MPATATNRAVQQLIDRQVAEGRQIGVQVCAYKDGRAVVDAWAGTMGPDDARPVTPDALFLSFSTTKGVAATALHILADRGLIDYDAPVAKYWPAFAQNGKGSITVAQAMSHQSGLHAMPDPVKPEHITDWDAGIKRMEEGVPAWEPGTATGYHAVTYGWIVGGIVQGASGRHIKDVIREEIAGPLGVADSMFVGIPAGLDARLATLAIIPAGEGLPIPDDADFYKAMPRPMWPHFNGMPFRQACLPSANGHFTARALARMYAALAGDGSVDGVRLVSPGRIKLMQRVMTTDVDRVLGVPMAKGIGYFMGGEADGIHGPTGPRVSAFGHSGAGGSVAFADPEAGLSVAVTLNKMSYPLPGEGVTLEICDLIRSELGVA